MVSSLFDLCGMGSRFPLETTVMHTQRECNSSWLPAFVKLRRDPYSFKSIMVSGHVLLLKL